jgi:hypothetical protein
MAAIGPSRPSSGACNVSLRRKPTRCKDLREAGHHERNPGPGPVINRQANLYVCWSFITEFPHMRTPDARMPLGGERPSMMPV